MKFYSRIHSLTVFTTAAGLALALGVTAFRAKADQWDKKTILTVSQPIQVKDTYLTPGTYVLKLMDSSSNRHVVQIFNSDQSQIIDTILAIPNYRLRPSGDSRFAFWETPPGTAKAMRAWFYPGDNFGQEFPYPKHLRQLEVASVVTRQETVIPAPAAPVPAFEPTPEPRTEAAPEQTAAPTQVDDNQRTEVAQVTPPPTPTPAAVPDSAPEPQPVSQPEELPRTASPYTLAGVAGMAFLGLYGLVRLKQPS